MDGVDWVDEVDKVDERDERLLAAFPETLVILGTDAAGKNHVAEVVARMLTRSGRRVEIREGWFSKTASADKAEKGALSLFQEQLFLSTFGINRYLIPSLITLLIRRDLRRFKQPDHPLIVVSHTGLRILAFYLGHRFRRLDDIRIPAFLDLALRAILPVTRAEAIVLDIEDHIRRQRIARRTSGGDVDPFDRYMARDSARSERIENIMVWLGRTYLNAVKIENNDLDEAELTAAVLKAIRLSESVP
jgi:hypothetical protein